jgi:hypothetical protein
VAARFIALLIALSTGATGILPAGDSYRCIIMDQRMAPGRDCCPKCDAPPLSIGEPCCEVVHGASLEARAPQKVEHPRLEAAPLVAVLPLAVPTFALGLDARNAERLTLGRPPGQQLRQLSQVLRI